ncbi:MAG TPA: CHRD domain-containing protein [Chitinophagaceae bacterium]|nr:CHRD domain-containing protein [Chitinophagaceae bacterium]
MKIKIQFILAIAITVISLTSCSKKDEMKAEVTASWSVMLNAKNEIPAVANRSETGTALIRLYSNNELEFDISVPNLTGGDMIQTAHLHAGNPVINGSVIADLKGMLQQNKTMGKISIRGSLADSLKNGMAEVYVNVHTSQVPSGLVRGQLNDNVSWATDVALSGSNEVPAVTTTTRGTSFLRITSSGKLYSAFTFPVIEAGDMLMAAHIHAGAAGVNGPVVLGIAGNTADFTTTKVFELSAALRTSILTDALYVNVHSMAYASGVVRGQIR